MTMATGHDARMLERHRAALKFAGIGAWEWDLRTGETWWSEHLYTILGRAPSAISTTLAAFLGCVAEEEGRESVRSAFRAVLQTGEPHAFACSVGRPDGAIRNCRGQVGAVPDDRGQSRLLLGTLRNTTLEDAVRRTPDGALLEALREERQELRAMVAAAPSPLVLVDSRQRILRLSGATEAWFGWPGAELVGQDLGVLFAEPYGMLDALLIAATSSGPQRVMRPVSVATRDGRAFAAEMTVVATPTAKDARFIVTFAPCTPTARTAAEAMGELWDASVGRRVDALAGRR